MKKKYEKPSLEITEFCFSEHIAASGSSSCDAHVTYLDFSSGRCTITPATQNS